MKCFHQNSAAPIFLVGRFYLISLCSNRFHSAGVRCHNWNESKNKVVLKIILLTTGWHGYKKCCQSENAVISLFD